jgi:hypothetical protein
MLIGAMWGWTLPGTPIIGIQEDHRSKVLFLAIQMAEVEYVLV